MRKSENFKISKISSTKRFVSERSRSNTNIKVLRQNHKIEENILFNYRGIGSSCNRLSQLLTDLFSYYKNKLKK